MDTIQFHIDYFVFACVHGGWGGGVMIFLFLYTSLYVCIYSTHIHRIFTPAFGGVRDNSSHSLARQFPMATKLTCFILLQGFILVLFISLYFYRTHMGICSVSLFV